MKPGPYYRQHVIAGVRAASVALLGAIAVLCTVAAVLFSV